VERHQSDPTSITFPHEHEQSLTLRNARIGGADDPDDWVVYLVPVVSVLDDDDSP
jgi:hypothetical protein